MSELPFDLPDGRVADANDLYTEPRRPVIVEAPPPQPQPEAPARRNRCVVIGPSGVGKTALLLAMQRACSLSREGEPDLAFLADADTAPAFRRAIDQMLDHGTAHHATREPETYRFQIWTRSDDGGLGFAEPLAIEIDDGPGGALFPAEHDDASFRRNHTRWRDDMVESLREADSIVVCVNAVNPLTNIWQSHLGALLAEAATVETVSTQRRTGWMFRSRRREHQVRVLKAKRLLILVTKIDQLGMRTREFFRHLPRSIASDGVAAAALSKRHARDLADLSDPVWLARALLGVSAVNDLRLAMTPGSAIAAGVCSAGGFDQEGNPFWRDGGQVAEREGEPDEVLVDRWAPYGIREALFFLGAEKVPARLDTLRAVERRDLFFDMHGILVR